MTKFVTNEQYLQLVGLLVLANKGMDRLEDIEAAIKATLHVDPSDAETSGIGDPQHIGDAIYSRYSPDDLLRKLGIARLPEREG